MAMGKYLFLLQLQLGVLICLLTLWLSKGLKFTIQKGRMAKLSLLDVMQMLGLTSNLSVIHMGKGLPSQAI